MLRRTDETHPFPAGGRSGRRQSNALISPVEHKRTVASAFGYGRGGTSPRLMMSYLLLSASIKVSSAICASLKPASSARN